MIFKDRAWVPGVLQKVFFICYLHFSYCFLSFERVKLLLFHLAKLIVTPGIFLLSGADYSLQIRFKTAAAIRAVVQRLLSYNTCRGFLILRSNNSSKLLHLPGLIELTAAQ